MHINLQKYLTTFRCSAIAELYADIGIIGAGDLLFVSRVDCARRTYSKSGDIENFQYFIRAHVSRHCRSVREQRVHRLVSVARVLETAQCRVGAIDNRYLPNNNSRVFSTVDRTLYLLCS